MQDAAMAIDHYDPLVTPDAKQWLALSEDERIQFTLEHHTCMDIEPPRVNAHALLHVIVENQIALGDETPVRLKVRQLMAQGLDRHEAIHAIASVLVKYLGDLVRHEVPAAEGTHRYYAALRRLTARKWLRSG
jgi:hypothetical protein